jgi:putative spermidine/putrescine transport system permease protein
VSTLGGRVAVALLALWFALPLVPLGLWSVADRWPAGAALPTQWGWSGWQQAVADGGLPALGRSAALGLTVAALATPLGALAGRALAWGRSRWHGVSAALLLLPVALPPFALAMGLDVLLLRLGIPGLVAVVALLVAYAVPYTTYVLRSAYAVTDPQLEDQARMLGATGTQTLRTVTLPVLAPALLAAAALAFLVGWSDYVVTVVIGGGRLVTAPVLVAAGASGLGNEPVVAVLSTLMVVPLVAAVLTAPLVARSLEASRTRR